VVVDNLNILRASGRPSEAEAILVVDTDTVLANPIALQRLEPISRRDTQIRQTRCDLQLPELSQCHALDEHPSVNPVATGQCRRVGIPERPDHDRE
jgi:hypothetical protein